MLARTIIAAAVLLTAAPAAHAAPVETFLEAEGPGGLLKGTLLTPENRPDAPVMVLIPGSGPTDRDGNNPMGVAGGPYRKLAEALAEEGIATLRVDKRGQFASGGASFGEAGPTIAAYAEDMKAWIAQARVTTGAECVWLAGHSEGGLVAQVTAQDAEGVCGLILISAGGRRLSDVIREQITSNPANPPDVLEQSERALGSLERGQRIDVSGFHPALQPLFTPQLQGFLISIFSYDPADLLKTYRGPVLIVQGTTDIQIRMSDARRLAAARPDAKLVVIEGMNHVLRIAPEDRMANAATYADTSLPLAPGVAEAIAEFIRRPR